MFFKKFASLLLDVEGDYSNDAKDRGGETICGIARNYWPHAKVWKPVDAMKMAGLPVRVTEEIKELAYDFYREHFWYSIRGDIFTDEDLAWEIFEFGVNAGTFTACKALQEALNLLNRDEDPHKGWHDILIDGKIGPVTLSTVKIALERDGGSQYLCQVINALQGEHAINSARADPSQERFLRGWLKRTIPRRRIKP